MVGLNVVVAVPRHVGDRAAGDAAWSEEDLHEAHAALDQPAGDQALPAEGRRLLTVQAVHFLHVPRLLVADPAPPERPICMR